MVWADFNPPEAKPVWDQFDQAPRSVLDLNQQLIEGGLVVIPEVDILDCRFSQADAGSDWFRLVDNYLTIGILGNHVHGPGLCASQLQLQVKVAVLVVIINGWPDGHVLHMDCRLG